MTKNYALVTGAAGGIGRCLVEKLNNAGWCIVGTDHPSEKPRRELIQYCEAWISADLDSLCKDMNLLEKFKDDVIAAAGGNIKAIIHNAALQRLGKFEALSHSDWIETMNVNLLAPALISKQLIKELRRNSGTIVNIGSIHSRLTKPEFTAYATSKAGLAGLTKAMAIELGQDVRVNGIEPAAIATPMLELGFKESKNMREELLTYHPTNCIGKPDDIARAVLFLLDEDNRFINGCIMEVGGGIHSRLHDPG